MHKTHAFYGSRSTILGCNDAQGRVCCCVPDCTWTMQCHSFESMEFRMMFHLAREHKIAMRYAVEAATGRTLRTLERDA